MSKEWKGVAWVGAFILIMVLYVLVNGDKESANQLIDILLYGYFAFAALSIIDGVYKWIKRFRQVDKN